MPRPKRPRCISARPRIRGFQPRGAEETGEIILSLEEFEVIRLIDHEGFDQAGVAEVMEVSRQTVGRILKSARFKIAESLVQAKRLTVQGGCYEMREQVGGRGRRRRGRRKL
ncbi:DUF134 domain-containing protein [Desulfospira joergensenii]|uniref:DUF134 domain-containing protein n=1 Tax=Desulfospira joergensenii TaxID=53329 RepID=UPI00040BBE00|nr:DUF134 domain-containing protein [Desulfospira joergensenii]